MGGLSDILYEVFTGKHPFSGFVALVAVSKIIEGERPGRPQEPALTDLIWDTTLGCWDQDPVQRPTMAKVVGILREWQVFVSLQETSIMT